MIGIIKKDLFSLKIQFIVFVLISFAYICAHLFIYQIVFEGTLHNTVFINTVFASFPLIMIMEFNCKNFQYEHEHSQCERFFNSLPITRTQMVIAKFLSSIIFSLLGLISSFICMTVFLCTDKTELHLSSYKIPVIIFMIVVICLAIQLPILMYNGNILLSMSIPAIIIFMPPTLIMLIKKIDANELMSKIIAYINKHHFITDNALIITFIITLSISVLSIMISSLIYKRRTFK